MGQVNDISIIHDRRGECRPPTPSTGCRTPERSHAWRGLTDVGGVKTGKPTTTADGLDLDRRARGLLSRTDAEETQIWGTYLARGLVWTRFWTKMTCTDA